MATMQFDASKKQILQTIHKNKVSAESDIKGIMPGKYCESLLLGQADT